MTSLSKTFGPSEKLGSTDFTRGEFSAHKSVSTPVEAGVSANTKRALLISPRYFGYEKDIAEEIRRQGYSLDFLSDRPSDNSFFKAITRLRPESMAQRSTKYYVNAIEDLSRPAYDYIVVIIGEAISGDVLRLLRTQYPNAKMVYYSWDSLKNKPQSVKHLTNYDQCFSFDPDDAKTLGVRYRPLFFVPGFERRHAVDFEYDLSFVGTIHSDRYRLTNQLFSGLPSDSRTYKYLYLQAHWMYWARRLLSDSVNGSQKKEFSFSSLTKAEVQKIFMSSRSVLDIEHPNQSGLTMRTIESVGAETKLVTTNARVREHDFYDPANVMVISRATPTVPADFLKSPYRTVPESIYSRYRLSAWVSELMSKS